MKRMLFTTIVVLAAMFVSGDLYAGEADTTSADKNNPAKETKVLTADKVETKKSFDLSLCISILALLAAGVSVVLSLRTKGNVSGDMKRMDTDLESLKDDVGSLGNKRIRNLETRHKELRDELSNLGREVDEMRMKEVHRPEASVRNAVVAPVASVYGPKIYYSVYQGGDDCFDESDFKDAPSENLPFKLTCTSPVEAEVEVMPSYNPSFNSQIKDACDAVSGSWTNFHSLIVVEKGQLYKDSEDSAYWKVRSKIRVRLS